MRLRRAALAGAFLIGLSTFQAEFDFGVPQFNFLFQPMLITLAAAVALTSARLWGGRGTALAAVVFFLIMRGLTALLVGGFWDEVTPHMPLYLAEAIIVEAVAFFMSTRRPLVFGVVSGGLIGTVGLAAEWAWSHVWMPLPWPSTLLPDAIVACLLMGVAGGVIGAFVGTTLRVRRQPLPAGMKPALAGAALIVVALVGFGLNTSADKGVKGTVALRDLPSADGGRSVEATVRLDPPDAAKDARWLTATDWQGGKLIVNRLEKVGDGVYRTTQPIPVHGEWKSLIRLHTGNSLTAIPIYLPEDKAIPAKGVPATPAFTRTFIADKEILQREAKDASPGLWAVAYGVVLLIVIALLGLLSWALLRLSAGGAEPPRSTGGRFTRRTAETVRPRAGRPMSEHVRIVIVGSGFAGLGMAIRLKQAGIEDFVVLERADEVGGTWQANTYPGCAVRRAVAPVLVLVRAEPVLDADVLAPAGDPRLPARVRAALRRPAPRPLRPRRAGGAVGRGRAALGARDVAGRLHRRPRRRRHGRPERAVVPRHPRPRDVRGRRVPLGAVGQRARRPRRARRGHRHGRLGDPDRPARSSRTSSSCRSTSARRRGSCRGGTGRSPSPSGRCTGGCRPRSSRCAPASTGRASCSCSAS